MVGVDEVGCGCLFGFVFVVVVVFEGLVVEDLLKVGLIDSKKLLVKCWVVLVLVIWLLCVVFGLG